MNERPKTEEHEREIKKKMNEIKFIMILQNRFSSNILSSCKSLPVESTTEKATAHTHSHKIVKWFCVIFAAGLFVFYCFDSLSSFNDDCKMLPNFRMNLFAFPRKYCCTMSYMNLKIALHTHK